MMLKKSAVMEVTKCSLCHFCCHVLRKLKLQKEQFQSNNDCGAACGSAGLS